MIYRVIILFCVLVNFFPSNELLSQIGSNTSQWSYDFLGVGLYGGLKVEYQKDTTIDEELTLKYIRTGDIINSFQEDTMHITLRNLFIQNIENVVYYAIDGYSFDVLYDFNASEGDEYYWKDQITNSNDSFLVRVDNVFSYEVDNVDYIGQIISYDLGGNFSIITDTIFQFYGSKNSYIVPYDLKYYSLDSGEGGAPICFTSNETGLVEFTSTIFIDISNFDHNCNSIISSESDYSIQQQLRKVVCFPNPHGHSFTIEMNDNIDVLDYLIITDNLGRRISEFSINKSSPEKYTISIQSDPGVYYILIENYSPFKVVKTQ